VWEARLGVFRRLEDKCRKGFSDESPALGANDGDACGCHDPFEGVVAVTLSALVLRVKVLDLVVSMTATL
jgi:hypothetical protein